MRNIHILSTEKPSRLVKIYNDINRETFTLKLDVEVNDSFKEYVNIYITSDEEITGFENDVWVYNNGRVWFWQNTMALRSNNKPKKIILTTDQDLIKDGVQAINDEFLEWFVHNSSCEWVDVVDGLYFDDVEWISCYKIIIPKEEYIFPDIKCKCIMFEPNSFTGMCKNCGFPPKEEPKTIFENLQEYLKNTPKEKILEDWNEFQHLDNEGITVKEFLENQKQTDEKGRPLTYWGGLEERKQETFVNEKCFKCGRNQYSSRKPFCTDDFCNKDFYQKPKQATLEEAAERLYPTTINSFTDSGFDMSETERLIFINGVKWQQEQNKKLYSEEDLREAFRQGEQNISYSETYGLDSELTEQQWFEQFKKK